MTTFIYLNHMPQPLLIALLIFLTFAWVIYSLTFIKPLTKYLWHQYFTVIPLDKKNRMLRIGAGLHDGKWFLRADLWTTGIRLARKS